MRLLGRNTILLDSEIPSRFMELPTGIEGLLGNDMLRNFNIHTVLDVRAGTAKLVLRYLWRGTSSLWDSALSPIAFGCLGALLLLIAGQADRFV